jgi:prepilin-type N-terminal cleavage/methylation domain-containing protein
MYIKSRLKQNNRGDTIIEVLIVLAILGMALGITYATASRSLLSTSGAQENSQATAYLKSQAETLRYLAPVQSGSQDIFTPSGAFCIDPDPSSLVTVPVTTPLNLTSYPAECIQGFYHVSIIRSAPDGNNASDFILTARWDDIHGDGTDSVTLTYRLYNE